MVKIKYDSLSEAFVEYNGICEDGLKELPTEVWDALDEYFNGLDLEFSNLSDLFDNLYINDLYTEDVANIDEDNDNVLFVDENDVAYVLA